MREDLGFIRAKAVEMEQEKAGRGVEYLEGYLMSNPLFEEYVRLLNRKTEEDNKKLQKEEDRYSLLSKVLRYPKSNLNYGYLKEFLKQDIPNKQRLIALRLLRAYTVDGKEKYQVSKKIYSITQDMKDLFTLGKDAFALGYHKEAFEDFSNSLPYSIVYLVRCYQDGLGTPKDSKKALALVMDGLAEHQEGAITAMERLTNKPENLLKYKPGAFTLSAEEKKNLISSARRKGYLLYSDVDRLCNATTEYKERLAEEYLATYGYRVYQDLETEREAEIYQALEFFELLRDHSLQLSDIYFITKYWLDYELIDFYSFGYDSDGAENYPFCYTPAEASLYLDIPSDVSLIRFDRLSRFLEDKTALQHMREMTYILKNNPEDFDTYLDKLNEELFGEDTALV